MSKTSDNIRHVGYGGPGSGNYWSDSFRSVTGNYMLMSSGTFDQTYGNGSYDMYYHTVVNHTGSLGYRNGVSGIWYQATTVGNQYRIGAPGTDFRAGFDVDVVSRFYGFKDAAGQGGPGWEPIVGTAGAIAGEMYYSKTYGTWMGKNFMMYQQTWGGNGATGGKLKFGKKVSTGIKIGGYGLGIWNAYKIDQQNRTGQITDGQMYMEQGSNLITTAGGLYGAAWGVGWELGRAVTNMEWYQEAKFNFWYNRWESQVGPPSQSNEALWYYFYQKYKP